MTSPITVTSTSNAQDMGYLALRDIDVATAGTDIEHLIVGGQAVTFLLAAHNVRDPRARETADADVAADFEVLATDELLKGLRTLGYEQEDGSRLSRCLTDVEATYYANAPTLPRPTIDIMGPTFSGASEHNRPAGSLIVDAFPGLGVPLSRPATRFVFDARLQNGDNFMVGLKLPAPDHLLIVKLLAWDSRLQSKDVIDIWRLLVLCQAVELSPERWRPFASRMDALTHLKEVAKPGSMALKRAGIEGREAAQFRALAAPAINVYDAFTLDS